MPLSSQTLGKLRGIDAFTDWYSFLEFVDAAFNVRIIAYYDGMIERMCFQAV